MQRTTLLQSSSCMLQKTRNQCAMYWCIGTRTKTCAHGHVCATHFGVRSSAHVLWSARHRLKHIQWPHQRHDHATQLEKNMKSMCLFKHNMCNTKHPKSHTMNRITKLQSPLFMLPRKRNPRDTWVNLYTRACMNMFAQHILVFSCHRMCCVTLGDHNKWMTIHWDNVNARRTHC